MSTCYYSCIPSKKIDEKDLNEDTYDEKFIKLNSDKIMQKIRLLMRESFFYKKEQLINLIQIPKKYPYVQIYAALTNLIEDNNEYIVDKYGRNGRLINIDEYYLFQPIEILDKNISIYERSIPIDYKHNMINFDLKPKEKNNIKIDLISESKIEEPEIQNLKGIKILDEIKNNFNLSGKYYNVKDENGKDVFKNVPRGDDNWYKHSGVVMRKMVKEYPDSKDYLVDFLIAHMIELLLFQEKIRTYELYIFIYRIK